MNKNRLIFAIVFHLFITVVIAGHFIRHPVYFPFVDDWMLVSWGTGHTEMTWANLWQTFNGHQYILVKIFSHYIGYFTSWNLVTSAVVGLLIGSIGYFLLIWGQLRQVKLDAFSFYVSCAGLSLLALTGRQGQNFFMISCLGWMFAIFFIGWYYFLKSLDESSQFRKVLLPIVVIMSPMTIALGLVVPLVELAEAGFRILREKNMQTIKANAIKIAVAAFAIYLSYIYPIFSKAVAPPTNFTSGADSMGEFFARPLQVVKFMFVLIAQPLLQWSHSSVNLNAGALIGVILSLFILWIYKNNKKNALADLIFNRFSIMAGVVFLFLNFLARYKALGVPGALEPRYTTGALVILIGMGCFFLKYFRYKALVAIGIMAAGIATHIIGTPVGRMYYGLRVDQSKELIRCFEQNKGEFSMEHPCFNLLYPGAFISKEEFVTVVNDLKSKNYGFYPVLNSIQK